MNLSDLNYMTVRISSSLSTGTGFIVKFAEQFKDGIYLNVPCIVTNKHVIEGAPEITVRFHSRDLEGNRTENQCEYTVPTNLFIHHPRADVDLCAMPIAELFKISQGDNLLPYYYGIQLTQIPNSNEQLASYLPSEDITVIGYPNGLWDNNNNLPIFRKGTLATAPAIDYQGNTDFLIDCAIYPGSSGSPVLAVRQLFNKETFEPFLSVKLLGVVYATYQHNARGEFNIINIPTSIDTLIPNHLGIVLNSTRLHELNQTISTVFSDTSNFLDARSEL